MKKLKLLGLFAMMLVVAMVLASCATVSNLKKVFNEDFDVNEKLYTSAEKLSDLDGYTLVEANSEFAVFADAEDGLKVKVFSFRAGEVVGDTLTSDEDKTYVVTFVDGAPIYVVTKTTATDDGDDKVMKYYHDATGAEIASVEEKYEIGDAKVVTDKLVIINAVMYNVDAATGALTEKGAVPAYVSYDNFENYNDEFFYSFDEETLIIYDLDFTPVATYTLPSYAVHSDIGGYPYVLNNGNVLIQYAVELNDDAKKFDFIEDTEKLDLVSVLVTPKGDVKDLDLDYVVTWLAPNYEVYDNTETPEENEFTDKWENIAGIAKIENKQLDFNRKNEDVVLMNNSAKAQKSLKLVDGQYGVPTKVADDLYVVDTVYGEALINGKGKLQFAVTEEYEAIVGGYIVTDRAIYDLTFTLVYDLIANEAEVIDSVGNTVFVKEGDEEKYSVLAFCNGEQKTVYSYDVAKETNKDFELTEFGYVIVDEGSYTYYAADGTEIKTFDDEIDFVASNNDDKKIFAVATEDGFDYYLLTK
ncbi:MAG: hypothetical protein J6Q82_05285 [Clostridia bacterium]|nr:hypothetical protein [Clostridia bacterium]